MGWGSGNSIPIFDQFRNQRKVNLRGDHGRQFHPGGSHLRGHLQGGEGAGPGELPGGVQLRGSGGTERASPPRAGPGGSGEIKFPLAYTRERWYNNFSRKLVRVFTAHMQKKTPEAATSGVLLCTYAHLPLPCLSSHLLTQLPTTLAMTGTRKLVRISSTAHTSFLLPDWRRAAEILYQQSNKLAMRN